MRKRFGRLNLLCLILTLSLAFAGCRTESAGEEHPADAVPAGSAAEEDTAEPYVYTFNPHVIAKEYKDIYGEEFETQFIAFCDALLKTEDTFPCPSAERFHQLLAVSGTCFPPAQELIDREKTAVTDGVCYLVYRCEKEEAADMLEGFKKKVTEVITSAVPYEEPDVVKAMELFTAVARKDTADESVTLEDALKLRSYRAIMQDTGICQEIAGEYIYYLLQTGINAVPCSSLNADQSDAHEWVLVQLNGKYYHMDPTFAAGYPDSLYFFGMDDIQREYYGNFPPENYTVADTDLLNREAYAVTDRTFENLWLAERYEIDHVRKRVKVTEINPGARHEYAFSEFEG